MLLEEEEEPGPGADLTAHARRPRASLYRTRCEARQSGARPA